MGRALRIKICQRVVIGPQWHGAEVSEVALVGDTFAPPSKRISRAGVNTGADRAREKQLIISLGKRRNRNTISRMVKEIDKRFRGLALQGMEIGQV